MREFEWSFDEGLKKGLRAEETLSRNVQALAELRNVKIGPAGLTKKPEITQPLSTSLNWPFPALVKCSEEWLLLDEAKVYRVNPSDWSKTEVISTAAGLSWHYADFFDYIVLTNGSKVYERDPSTGSYAEATAFPTFKTVCGFRGQLIAGNVSSSFHDCDSGFVLWSGIGRASFEPDEKHEAGYRPAGIGEIFKVLPLKVGFVAYGSDGIKGYFPTSRPVVQFGEREIAGFGIASRDAVGGDENGHILVDDKGTLWLVSGEFEIKRLGYEEFFEDMLGNDIVVSHNPNPGEFFIADGNTCFMLQSGLSEIYEIPTSMNFYDGGRIGVYGNGSDANFLTVSGPVDLGWRGVKRFETLELGVDCNAQVWAALDWRTDTRKDWRTSDWKRINQHGNVWLGVRASEFRIRLKTKSPAEVNLDWMKVRFKLDDKRAVRGQYDVG